ncbi:hypothetical protein NA57DRAFT_59219 [Rhizodiscina lignyota]|uniref:Cyclase n=1 Tax=Rhizodiscina lignyota TaxID=1504668 RepID=A0A9P4M2Y8_9PEZI|nr:hypothetical protein NA57DRAFT_59219 [Rhizodiscina lignyota]
MSEFKLPSFDDLPLRKDGPPGNAWGLFGDKDQMGRLNLITPATRKAAATEIKEGISVSLDWPLDKPKYPNFERQVFKHTILSLGPKGLVGNDDHLDMNTQSSTQWDGFRHYAYQKEAKFYNGNSQEDFENNENLGINVWTENGGIVGRGVLLDWLDWAQRNNIHRDPFQTNAVELKDIKAIIAEQNITIKQGDILFIRVGFSAKYNTLSASEQVAFPDRQPKGLLGVEATKDSLRWIWESGISAIASDSPSLERGPQQGPYNEPGVTIHQWALAGWGLPLGEMFDLERLSEECKRLKRYSFFVTSVPLKVPGGIASPPNAIAIF